LAHIPSALSGVIQTWLGIACLLEKETKVTKKNLQLSSSIKHRPYALELRRVKKFIYCFDVSLAPEARAMFRPTTFTT